VKAGAPYHVPSIFAQLRSHSYTRICHSQKKELKNHGEGVSPFPDPTPFNTPNFKVQNDNTPTSAPAAAKCLPSPMGITEMRAHLSVHLAGSNMILLYEVFKAEENSTGRIDKQKRNSH